MISVVRDLTGLIGLAEQVKFMEAQVALLLTDNETTEQLPAATSSVKVTDVGVGDLLAAWAVSAASAGATATKAR